MILKKQTLVVAMMSSLLVTGCATNDGDRTRMEGAGLGALIGAVVGGIAGDEKGAVLGALIGGGAGFIVGNEIAKRKQQYATTEEFLDAEVAHVQAINDSTVSYNKNLRTEIAQLDREATRLRSQYTAGQVKQTELEKKRASLQQQLATNRELEQGLVKELKVQERILSEERPARSQNDPYIARLEKEVKALQANLSQLRDGSSQLASIDQRLSV